MTRISPTGPAAIAVVIALLIVSPAAAATWTWTGTASGSWNDPNNWSPASVPANTRATQLTFDATANGVMTNDIPATLNVFNLNSMTFTAAAPAYSLGGDTLSFLSTTGGQPPIVTMNSNNPVTISSPINLNALMSFFGTGTGTLTLNGTIAGPAQSLYAEQAGTLALNGTNTYTGGTFVYMGATLAAATIANGGTASAIGASSNAATNLNLGSATSRGDLVLTGTDANYSTDRGVTVTGVFGNNNYGGAIGVQNAATTLTWNGQITGAGSLLKTGAGTLVLTNTANNYTGNTVIGGGTLAVGASGAVLPAGLPVTVQSGGQLSLPGVSNTAATALGPLAVNGGAAVTATGAGNYYMKELDTYGGTVDLSGSNGFGLHLTAANGIFGFSFGATAMFVGGPNSAIYNDSGGPVPIDVVGFSPANGVDLDVSIPLSAGGANPTFLKTDFGTLRLTSLANTANITINGGNLRVDDISTNGVGALGTGTISVTGGTLQYGGPTASSPKDLTVSGTLQILNPGINLTLTGTLSGPGGFAFIGPGNYNSSTLTLAPSSGANTYGGATSVYGFGVLAIGSITNAGTAGALGPGAAGPAYLVLGNDTSRGTLLYTGTDASPSTDRGITLGGVSPLSFLYFAGGEINVQNAGTNLTLNGQLTGGTLFKSGSGTLTLTNAANNFSQEVDVQAGKLVLTAAGAIPAGTVAVVYPGASLEIAPTVNGAAATSMGQITLNTGTLRIPAGSPNFYTAALGLYPGTLVDFTGSTNARVFLTGIGATALGNATWTGGGTSGISTTGSATITIKPTFTLTSSALLYGQFTITGGGTYYATGPAYAGYAPLTVSQARVHVDDLSVGNNSASVLGLNGNGTFTLDGGTLQYGGPSQSSPYYIVLGAGGGTVEVSNPATALTLTGPIYGFTIGPPIGPFTKAGPGVLALTNTSNTYTGGLIVNAGRLDISDDAQLGVANPVINQFGTLRYTASTTTARTFTLNSGTLEAPAGVTLTLNGAAIGGGFLSGQGTFTATGGTAMTGVTTFGSTTINVTGAASFTNFSNGSALTVAANLPSPTTLTRFTNQGSAAITVGAGSQVNVADFQTYGTVTLSPGTTAVPTQLTNTGGSPLYFNGGSRTFLSQVGHAPLFDAGIDLHGQNAVVGGGLFVNNGYVVDSMGSHAVIADYGALVKGAGFYQNTVQTVNGGKFQSGNSPGVSSFGNFIFGPGGVTNYLWQIDDPGPSPTGMFPTAPGVAGGTSSTPGQPDYGWSLIKAIKVGPSPGNFTWTATTSSPLTIIMQTLTGQTTVGNDVLGPMQNFDPLTAGWTSGYTWQFVTWAGTYAGPTDSATLNSETIFDLSSGPFANTLSGQFFDWQLKFNSGTSGPGELDLTLRGIPEPGTLALVGAAAFGGLLIRRQLPPVRV
jgi:autotransporter-associated beta strand protein